MEKIGIICEYNPFHNGHIYHINKIKEMFPESLIILVLNGYFLQRGEISIQTKEDKTEIALNNNVDIVLELPFIFGTQSADAFAEKSVEILNNFGVEKIIFGSESNNINDIKEIAEKSLSENFNKQVKEWLDKGINYPTALAKALQINFDFTPNDLLGISYAKAVLKNNFNIELITIKRTNNYHDIKSNDQIVSASNIRERINNNENISKYLPTESMNHITNYNQDTFFKLLKSKIITDNNLKEYLDVDEGIEYRLKEVVSKVDNLEDFINEVKTKRYTYNKINRMFIHILIGLKKIDNSPNFDYIKILGFNKRGQDYLNQIKDSLQITTTVDKNSIFYKYEIQAAIIYDLINNTKTFDFEQKNKPIITD